MEKNKLEVDDIEWRHASHMTLSNESHFVLRDDRFNIQKEEITKRDGHGKTGSTKRYYYIDAVAREFTSAQDLCDAWNERYKYDDPNNEIIWVKKIVPTIDLTKH